MLIAFGVWLILVLFFVVLGIVALFAKEAMTFWTHDRVIEVDDLRVYNRKLAILYFVYSVVLLLFGIPLLFMKQNSAGFIIPILGLPISSILMMAVYTVCIESKHRKH